MATSSPTQQATKKVLILAYYWPPSGGSGVQRWLKFVKYLRVYGWEPVVITPKHGTAPYYDDTLLRDVPEGVKVYKTDTFEPFELYNRLQGKKKDAPIPVGTVGIKDPKTIFQKVANYIRANLFIPDARRGWRKYAVEAAKQAIAENPEICVMATTGPPHSVHLAGLDIKKMSGLPWVADLRDPWTNIFYNKELPRTESTKRRDKALEDSVLKAADVVTVTSWGTGQEFENRAREIQVIFNGFDEDDIYTGALAPADYFRLAHVGNFFPFYDSPGLWQAIAELTRENADFARYFRLSFTGVTDAVILQKLYDAGLREWVENNAPVPHHEATRKMFEAAMLLFVIPNDGSKGVIAGKTFEYLASGTSILTVGDPQANVSQILTEQKRLAVIDYNDTLALKAALLQTFEAWLSGGRITRKFPDSVTGSPYSRKALTGRLAAIFDRIKK
ncbi:hypothetical protein SAMN05421780_102271 [Flexibacter flexilis DSM 6793]|uniref:Uncharacterized protein n=1 Tax=Flexibacter flexilis DSM 6793 TaxID=927664 RepID=A0A1I1FWA3_9BACT|nr:hypothetical protein [Flexibacter flexilis]SFC01260.1 hypothetical protein SAMN05421780_102271 [Flexibacter flexilis DSM 6793]